MSWYDKNIVLLRRINPGLASIIEKIPVPDTISFLETPAGSRTCSVISENGSPSLLHSKYDPVKEAGRFIEKFTARPLENYIVLGLGLGYHLAELSRTAKKESYIFVIEKDAALLKASMQTIDWSEIFNNPRVILLVGITPDEVYKFLRNYLSKIFSGNTTLVPHQPSMTAFPSFYEQVKRNIVEFIKSGMTIFSTTLILPKKTCVNRINNLPAYLFAAGVNVFENRFKSYPAIIVSAGPSLNRNMHLLKKAQDRAVIIAVSTSVKKLIASGIRPHFTAILDYHDISRRYFEGIDAESGVTMIADPRGNFEAIGAFRGNKVFTDDEVLNITLRGMAVKKGHLEHGATVAHLAFLFGRYIGAEPIIFTGQDLSYPDGVTHIPGTAIYTQWRSEINRFSTFESKEWEYIQRYRENLTKIKDVNGNDVYTDNNMLSYLKDFELMCETAGVGCVNSTEGGADIKNTEKIPLEETIARYCTRIIPPERFSLPVMSDGEKKSLAQKAVSEIDARLDECMRLNGLYDSTLKLLNKVIKEIDAGRDADPLVIKVLKLREDIMRYEELYRILSDIAKSDSMLSEKWDRKMLAEDLRGSAKQREQAERNTVYLSALKSALLFYTDLIEDVRLKLADYEF